MVVECLAYYGKNALDLTGEDIVIEIDGDRVELVPGSVTEKGFTLQFVKNIGVDVTADQNVRVYNSATPALTTTGKISITQIGDFKTIEMGEGFQTTGAGDQNNPVTLNQTAKLPD